MRLLIPPAGLNPLITAQVVRNPGLLTLVLASDPVAEGLDLAGLAHSFNFFLIHMQTAGAARAAFGAGTLDRLEFVLRELHVDRAHAWD